MGQTKDIKVQYIGWPADDRNLLSVINLFREQPNIKVIDSKFSPHGCIPDVAILGKREHEQYLKDREDAEKWRKEHPQPVFIDTSGLGDYLRDGH